MKISSRTRFKGAMRITTITNDTGHERHMVTVLPGSYNFGVAAGKLDSEGEAAFKLVEGLMSVNGVTMTPGSWENVPKGENDPPRGDEVHPLLPCLRGRQVQQQVAPSAATIAL
ncbi:MAG: hypothetical protein HQ536_04335 [Parcubacteria group bacterium]|nr:hypothetical protein [Parcubacteria group bacterium]